MNDDYNREFSTSRMENIMDIKDVDGATSIPNSDNGWEMRLNGIKVEPQIGKLEEVWKNVTVEIVRMPNDEFSIGWKPQSNTERIL